ncbi:NACHT domain-containing protein [Streptomyces althioticus]|uniref:NACHT domain-containing protein n=1 Tax=Streptomyces althioticus TaxID=83380 RepID=UPI00331DD615
MSNSENFLEDVLRTQGEVTYEESHTNDELLTILTARSFTFTTRTLIHAATDGFDATDAQNALQLYSDNRDHLLLDHLLVVTPGEIASEIERTLSSSDVKVISYTQLLLSAMDFTPYLRSLISNWRDRKDGIANYYIPVSTKGGQLLEDLVREWLDDDDPQPIAILGSYGIGKSVSASKLAHDLAIAHMRDKSARIPIMIRLGDIAHEQKLEGLLSSSLTGADGVRNFSHTTFHELNRAGKTVIILDGFDEMKRGITWDAFIYNLSQLNLLVDGDSRVLLLGRPNAFMDEKESLYALHGKQKIGGSYFKEPDWPDYREVEIELLSAEQVDLYAERYLRHRAKVNNERNEMKVRQRIARIQRQLRESHVADIASRPVQLMMLLEVLPDWDRSLQELGVPVLYSHFIDKTIRREAERPSRSRYGLAERRRFARDLAWWMWSTPRDHSNAPNTRVSASEIPSSLLQEFTSPGEDIEVARRDLVSACFLDTKSGGHLVFPHRSFQEFLTAEYLAAMLSRRDQEINLDAYIPYITREVADFLAELIGHQVPYQLSRALADHKGSLPWHFLRIWAQGAGGESEIHQSILKERHETKTPGFTPKKGEQPWWSLIATFGYLTGVFPTDPSSLIARRLKESGGHPTDAALYLYLLLLLSAKNEDPDLALKALSIVCDLGTTYDDYLASVTPGPHRIVRQWRERGDMKCEVFRPLSGIPEVILRISYSLRKGKRFLNVQGMRAPLLNLMRGHVVLSEIADGQAPSHLNADFPTVIRLASDEVWNKIQDYQRDFAPAVSLEGE